MVDSRRGVPWVLAAAVVAVLGCDPGTEEAAVTGTGASGGGTVAPPAGGGTGGSSAGGGGTSGGSGGTGWRQANLTVYESYPDPGSEECIEYNGCTWAGQFAALDGVQPESWVRATNIAAVRFDHFDQYRLKTLRVRQDGREIDVTIYDLCSDNDCSGCCTRNSSETGFLIDMEINTADRFGSRGGIVQWTCLDCP